MIDALQTVFRMLPDVVVGNSPLHVEISLQPPSCKATNNSQETRAASEMGGGDSVDVSSTIFVGIAAAVVAACALNYWSQRKSLGPRQWFLLGGMIEQVSNYEQMHDWFLSYFDKGIKTFKVSHVGISYTYTVDPANVEYILKTRFSNFPKGETFHSRMEALLGDGIFNSDGDMWKKQRKTASFEFASRILRDFSTVSFREYGLQLAFILTRASSSKQAVDMQDLFMRLTLDSICKVGFGAELGNLSPDLPEVPFATAFDNANTAVTLRFFDPLWKLKRLLNVGWEKTLRESVRVVDDFTYKVVRARRSEIGTSNNATSTADGRADLLSRFIMIGGDPENNFSDKTLRDVILNFVIAGRDTTAVTLSWLIYRMTLHPEVADKLHEELRNFEKGKMTASGLEAADDNSNLDDQAFLQRVADFAKLLTYEDLAKLNYLHATVTEAVRLHPAVPQDPKGILEDDVLPDGTPLKKGDLVCYLPYSMARMKFLWGPDAREFRPERWLKDGVFQPVSPFKFTSFQAGPRICLGKDSAYLQMKMVTAIVCRFFKFQVVPGHPVQYRMMAILSMAQGLKAFVQRR